MDDKEYNFLENLNEVVENMSREEKESKEEICQLPTAKAVGL